MKTVWDEVGKKTYETGVDHGVLYDVNAAGQYVNGVAWNGLTGVTQSPSGAEQTPLWADNIKYLNLTSAEEFGATVTAYTYPEEWEKHDGSAELADGVMIGQQNRTMFGLSYRTVLGNDIKSNDYGYKLHLIYGALASPSEKNYQTINDSPEAIEFSWEITTTPVQVTGYKPTAILTIDSTKTTAEKMAAIEAILYGTDGTISYSEVSSPTGNPSTSGYYERSGSAGSYVYTLSSDTTVDVSKTYYERVETGGTTARMPLPDEVKTIMAAG